MDWINELAAELVAQDEEAIARARYAMAGVGVRVRDEARRFIDRDEMLVLVKEAKQSEIIFCLETRSTIQVEAGSLC